MLLSVSVEADASSGESPQSVDSVTALMKVPLGNLPTFDSLSSVEDYVAVAVRRNPGLRGAYHRWVADQRRTGYAGAMPDPMFMYGHMFMDFEPTSRPMEQRFGLQQSIPWFGTLGAKKAVASAAAHATFEQFDISLQRLLYDVKSAYYEYYYLGRNLQITRDNFDLMTFWESVARAKYRVGLKQHPDVIMAQVELGKLEDRVQTLEEAMVPAAARLRALLDLPNEISLSVPAALPVVEAPLVADSVIDAIIRNNPDIRALRFMVEKEKAGERVARRSSYPDFLVGVEYIEVDEAVNIHTGQTSGDSWMVTAGISLPIWFGKNAAARDEAAARHRAAEYNRHDLENSLVAAARQTLFNYSDALRKVRLYRDGLVPKAEQSLNSLYTAYQAGETDFLNLLDAQRQLLAFQLTLAREQANLAARRAQLEMMAGTNLKVYEQD